MTENSTDRRGADADGLAMRFGPYRLLRTQRLLLDGSRTVPVSSRAMDILLALVEQPGRVLSRDDLITRAWPNTTVDDVNLRVHVSALRRVLGDSRDGQPYLVTVPGRGYRFVGSLASEPAPLPQPNTTRSRPPSLPLPLARVIGRTGVIARIRAHLPQRRFVTVVGPGGMGKTTVATAVADAIGADYPDGVQWVDLAALDRDDTVPAAVAFALGLANFSTDPSPGVAAALQRRAMLLVLDSCERVVAGAAALAERIRDGAPDVHILTTSREPLRARGEHLVRLRPLGLPAEPEGLTVAQAMGHPAIQLFVERAAATVDGFTLSDANAALVARICARLDGIALAIELAAGHLAAFELQSLSALLDDRFRLMAAGRRTALPRHRTMQATLEWSYETLPEHERIVLARLAVFGGAASLPAIRAVAADAALDEDTVVTSLVRLVDKSLVAADIGEPDVRYRLLDTTRAYALEKLVAGNGIAAVARRHAEYYRRQLGDIAAFNPGRAGEYSAGLADDLANVRAALDWAASPDGDRAVGVALTVAAVPLWMQLSLLGECRARVTEALAVPRRDGPDGDGDEMTLRAALGMALMYTRGPVDDAAATWARVLELAERTDDAGHQLWALYGLWLYNVLVCEFRKAEDAAGRFRRVAERDAAAGDLATSERMMGMALHYLGDQAGTRACSERSIAAPVPANRHVQTAHYGVDQRVGAFVLLARALWLQGLPDQAARAAQGGVDEAATLGHANSMCVALADGAALVAVLSDDVAAAGRYTDTLAEHAETHALGVWRTYALALRGRLMLRRGAAAQGAVLLRSALADLRATPFDIRYQLYLMWLAEALGEAGQPAEAEAAISEALQRAERTDERWHVPELLRIRGEMLHRQGTKGVQACLARSLDMAQSQAALAWELRTAISIARLASDLDAGAARSRLGAVLARFTEGFATGDLLAARQLLDGTAD